MALSRGRKIAAVLLVVFATLAGAAAYRVTRFPVRSGDVAGCAVGAPVEVHRDAHGIPHILASSPEDAYFALGFVEAQDRTLQLEVFRRAASGTLAELIGEAGLPIDRLARTIGFRRIAAAQMSRASPEAISLTGSFVAGLNRGIDSLAHLPVECSLLGARPEPWTPLDCMALARLLSFSLAEDMKTELLFARLRDRLGEERALALLPANDVPDPRVDRAALPTGPTPLPPTRALEESLLSLERTLPRMGCSNWIVSGARSRSGKPLFAYDSHQGGPRIPGEVYLAHLSGGERLDVMGGVLVGLPGIYSGVTRTIAFGPTDLFADAQDLLVVALDPSDPAFYVVGGRRLPFTEREETIPVRGVKEPLTLRIRETLLGPVVSDGLEGAAGVAKEGEVLVLRWAGARRELRMDGFVTMPLARDWTEFRAMLDHFESAAQHFGFASTDGTIAYQASEPVPRRTEAPPPWPLPASAQDLAWAEAGGAPLLTLDELPHLVNPPEGFVATANHKPPKAGKPYYLGRTFVTPARRDRLVACVTAKEKMTLDDLIAVGHDLTSPFAERLAPRMAALLTGATSEKALFAREALSGWDHRMTGEGRAPAVFHALYSATCRALLEDELCDLLPAYAGRTEHGSERIASLLLEEAESPFWDDARTPERETRAAILERAARDAITLLEARLGRERASWRWDRLHTITYEHYLHGATTLLDAGPFPVPGDDDTPFRFGQKPLDDSFKAEVLTLLRVRADMADPSKVLLIASTGQSGWALDAHALDLLPIDLAGGLLTIPREREAIVGETRETQRLLPR